MSADESKVPDELPVLDELTPAGVRLRAYAAAREDPVPCGRAHRPDTACLLPEDHEPLSTGWLDEYEDLDGQEVTMDPSDWSLAGGFTLRAATMPTREGESGLIRTYPMLVFDFVGAGGARFRPVALVMDEEELAGVSVLIGNAAHGAVAAARRADNRDPKTGRRIHTR